MVGELAALRATQNGGRSAFLLPTKALVNEQFERFQRAYSVNRLCLRTTRASRPAGQHRVTRGERRGTASSLSVLLAATALDHIRYQQCISHLGRGTNPEVRTSTPMCTEWPIAGSTSRTD